MSASVPPGVNAARIRSVLAEEIQRFIARTPVSRGYEQRASAHMPRGVPMPWMAGLWRTPPIYIAGGLGGRFTDVDGHDYVDFNLCDLSLTVGFGHPAVTQALAEQAARGTHFLLPTVTAVEVSELLAERTGVPYWHYTLSASQSNTEVIRIARYLTGRSRVVLFGGHYHGHIEETLVRAEEGAVIPDTAGLSPGSAAHTTLVPFNDVGALEAVLARGDVALVLTEPALTNCNLVLPEEGFHSSIRRLTREHGALWCIDEAHTFQFAYGGLTRAWQLDPDFLVLGKGLGSGVAFAMYGMSAAIGAAVAKHTDGDVGPRGIALGGTTYGSAMAMSVAKAMLNDVLTEAAYASVCDLGLRLATGLQQIFDDFALPWRAFHLGPRSGYCLSAELPRNGTEAWQSLQHDFIDARRAYMANRGVWDAVASAGPQASLAHTSADIDHYLALAEEFLTLIR